MNRAQVGKAVKKPGRQSDQKGPKEKRLLFVYGLSQQSRAWAGVTSKYLHLLRFSSKLYNVYITEKYVKFM